jgi:hypothetical protein
MGGVCLHIELHNRVEVVGYLGKRLSRYQYFIYCKDNVFQSMNNIYVLLGWSRQ